jgi:hypothetical protein
MDADMPPQSIKKDGGYGIVSTDHIKPIPKLKHIFENRHKGIILTNRLFRHRITAKMIFKIKSASWGRNGFDGDKEA